MEIMLELQPVIFLTYLKQSRARPRKLEHDDWEARTNKEKFRHPVGQPPPVVENVELRKVCFSAMAQLF